MRALVDALVAVLLAPECAVCREPLPHPTAGCVCERCWCSIVPLVPPLCDRCGAPLGILTPAASISRLTTGVPKSTAPPMSASAGARDGRGCRLCALRPAAFERARSAGLHSGALRDIVHALKYDGRRSLAGPLARLMRQAAPDLLVDAAAVVPVPLHASKRRARGFNQAHDLARGLGLPIVAALRRRRATQSQTELAAAERLANVDGAFAVTRHAAALRGSIVVLVDDVRTTGATLDACARTLRKAGVREVRALTAALAELPPG